jgi:hypothetical protein
MTTSLELDDEQVDVMREILEAQQAQLLAENARVETADFRRLILHRLEVVEKLLSRLPKYAYA